MQANYASLDLDYTNRLGYQYGMTLLEQLRKAKGLSQAQLAELVDTTQPTIQRLEKSKRELSKDWAEKLAPHLGVTPQELMFSETENPGKPTSAERKTSFSTLVENEGVRRELDDKIISLIGKLSARQKSAFLTMLESFLTALGVPEDQVYGDHQHIEENVFLGVDDGHLDSELLMTASANIRNDERALTSHAIFNSDEYDRRLKREYNSLYLEREADRAQK